MTSSRVVAIIVQAMVLFWVVSWLLRLLRRQSERSLGEGRPTSESGPRVEAAATSRGAVRHRDMLLHGVLWRLTWRPRSAARTETHAIYVEQPPRCPECGLGVVETESWLGYTWSCPSCGRRWRSRQSMQAVAEELQTSKGRAPAHPPARLS